MSKTFNEFLCEEEPTQSSRPKTPEELKQIDKVIRKRIKKSKGWWWARGNFDNFKGIFLDKLLTVDPNALRPEIVKILQQDVEKRLPDIPNISKKSIDDSLTNKDIATILLSLLNLLKWS